VKADEGRRPRQRFVAHGLLGAACRFENDCLPGLFCREPGGRRVLHEDLRRWPCPARRGMAAICTRLSGEYGIYCLQA